MVFAEISGSAVADVAALGSILIPEMKLGLLGAVRGCGQLLGGVARDYHPAVDPDDLLRDLPPALSWKSCLSPGSYPVYLGGLGLMAVAWWFAKRYNFPVPKKVFA